MAVLHELKHTEGAETLAIDDSAPGAARAQTNGTGKGAQAAEQDSATLDDFELMCVLGRGGFGKVMQEKHKESGEILPL